MKQTKFFQLREQINSILEKSIKEALDDGINISSDKFQKILAKLKKILLEEKGLTLEEYEAVEHLLDTTEDHGGKVEIAIKKLGEESKIEFKKGINDILQEFQRRIDVLIQELEAKEKTQLKPEDVKNIIQPLIPVIPKFPIVKYYDKDITGIIERLNSIKIPVIPKIKDWTNDIKNLQLNLISTLEGNKKEAQTEREKAFNELKELRMVISGESLEIKLKDLLGPAFRRLGMGLQGQIDGKMDKSKFVDGETPSGTINGTNAEFTLANTPNPVASLQLFLNGAFQTAGGEDYTLASATITFVNAPLSGSILRASYRY